MAESTVVKNFRDGTVVITDGASATYTVGYEAGDFQFERGKDEIAVYRDRGNIASVRKTNQGTPSGSFSVMFRDLTDGTDATLTDILDKNGSFSAAVSTLGSSADVYTVKLAFQIEGTDHGDATDHEITFDDCYCTWSMSEGDPNSCSVSWTSYGTVTQT